MYNDFSRIAQIKATKIIQLEMRFNYLDIEISVKFNTEVEVKRQMTRAKK